ncbi:MAG: hypothetical protein LBN06_07740 [Prevotellaceae bacterium]|jgi:hypothetical protein|nr:hypothetical protein [Prevotellaceae bacterium]
MQTEKEMMQFAELRFFKLSGENIELTDDEWLQEYRAFAYSILNAREKMPVETYYNALLFILPELAYQRQEAAKKKPDS